MSAKEEFIQKVDEIYGIYLDATSGFHAFREVIVKAQKAILFKELSLSEEDLDIRRFTFGRGDPDQKGSYELHSRTHGEVKERNQKDGSNYRIIANLCLVLIYQYWEDYSRPKIAGENGVEKNGVEWDVMRELGVFRHSIIHNQGVATSKVENCKILNWGKGGKEINIDEKQFEEIVRQIKETEFTIVHMDTYERRHQFDQYQGSIVYATENCKNSFRYLKERNDELNQAWTSGDTSNINELGELDRVFKDYLILKVAALFDKHRGTLSLINFGQFLEVAFPEFKERFSQGLKEIQNKYLDIIQRIIDNRHGVVAHFGSKMVDNLIHTEDLLNMPILELLKEVEDLMVSVNSPIFSVE